MTKVLGGLSKVTGFMVIDMSTDSDPMLSRRAFLPGESSYIAADNSNESAEKDLSLDFRWGLSCAVTLDGPAGIDAGSTGSQNEGSTGSLGPGDHAQAMFEQSSEG